MATERRVEAQYIDGRFGFEVLLESVPMKKVRGEWVPEVNANLLRLAVLSALVRKPAPLTGDEVRFVRHALQKSTPEFGSMLGQTHVAVLKWEKAGAKPTRMNRSTEFRLRLLLIEHLPVEIRSRMLGVEQTQVVEAGTLLSTLTSALEGIWDALVAEDRADVRVEVPGELLAQQSLPSLRSSA